MKQNYTILKREVAAGIWTLLLLGVCFLRGVPEDVVGEIGEEEKDNMGIGLAVR